jgi:galactokinase
MENIEQITSLDELIEINQEIFFKEFHKSPDLTATAPGRINIIGEHTDYNQGLSMPAAINRWVVISFKRRKDEAINIKSINFNSELNYTTNSVPITNESWQKYIFGAIEVFKEKNILLTGFDALIWGNVPLGSGVSSSAALEVAMMNGLRALYETNVEDFELVKLCQKIEHEYLHVKSGLLDQYASQFSKQGAAMVLDLNSLQHQYVHLETQELEWVLVESGVKRELAHSGYSQRVKETSEAFEFLKAIIPSITNFRDIKFSYLNLLPNEIWKKRLEHYIFENQRVIKAMDHIQNNDFEALGKLLNQSHESLRDLYEVSCTELDFLANSAQSFEGCLGSRMMGGGFGGCTLNLIRKDHLSKFTTYIKNAYQEKFNVDPSVDNFSLVEGACIHKNY